jgi:hypothetical protein
MLATLNGECHLLPIKALPLTLPRPSRSFKINQNRVKIPAIVKIGEGQKRKGYQDQAISYSYTVTLIVVRVLGEAWPP